MCGFAGVLNLSGLQGSRETRAPVLSRMAASLAHRGPDDERFYDDGVLALCFRRLSIVDVQGGQQPLWNEDRSILAVVNGEIYNHQDLRARLAGRHHFGTLSDSEVLLHLYEEHGLDFLRDVNGIFAVAIWDTGKRRLLLARDRLGVKPLYYTFANGNLLFASELKAMLAHPQCPREMDWQQVQPRPWHGRPVTPSYVRDVHHLPGGFILESGGKGSLRPHRYWSVDEHFSRAGDSQQSARDHIERYSALFEDSVRRQLMSDVPLGILLSGGVDSALITAAAAAQQTGLHCFTLDEHATRMSGDLQQAQRVAESLGNPLHVLKLGEDELFSEQPFDLAELENMVWTMDSPRFGLEIYFKYRLHRFIKSIFPEIKVVLIGQGADEFCGGYTNEHGNSFNGWSEYVEQAALPMLASFDEEKTVAAWPFPGAASDATRDSQLPVFHRIMQYHVKSLQFYNLWHEDRTSSALGIEARVPFLDHRLVELCASVPPEMHAELFWDKQIVRAQLPRWLPDYPVNQAKVPFIDVPGNTSIRGIYARMLSRVFPEFQQSYPHFAPGTPLGAQALELHARAAVGQPGWYTQARKLLHIMCTAIFERRISSAA